MEEDKDRMLKTSFSYTDEFGETTTLTKELTQDVLQDGEVDFLLGEFKFFLLSIGYTSNCVDKIQYNEEEES